MTEKGLRTSPLFERHVDTESGLESFVLSSRVAPVQLALYFTQNAWTADGRYLWIACAYPPAGKQLAVIDLDRMSLTAYPETALLGDHSPYIDAKDGAAYWCSGASVWTRGPGPEPSDVPRRVNALPEEVTLGRQATRLATHLSRSADERCFLVDAEIDQRGVLGALPLDGGDFELWCNTTPQYKHGLFSPTDPDVAMVAEDNWIDPVAGTKIAYRDRLWIARRGASPAPVFPTPTRVTHEWWDAAGTHLLCIRSDGQSDMGVWRVDIATGAYENLWPSIPWHANLDPSGRFLVADNNQRTGFYRGCPSTVRFFSLETRREVTFLHNPERRDFTGRGYHIDPHPRFSPDGRFIVSTTTVRGEIDVAITPVAQLVDRVV